MTYETSGFSAAYHQWAEAEGLVSEFEREIFHEGHQLTAQELSCLRVLRGTAAARLSLLINDIDTEFGRLHAMGDPAAIDIQPIGDGVFLAVGPEPSP